jgi:hypothetical protein
VRTCWRWSAARTTIQWAFKGDSVPAGGGCCRCRLPDLSQCCPPHAHPPPRVRAALETLELESRLAEERNAALQRGERQRTHLRIQSPLRNACGARSTASIAYTGGGTWETVESGGDCRNTTVRVNGQCSLNNILAAVDVLYPTFRSSWAGTRAQSWTLPCGWTSPGTP